jgi:GNAT superfamily N-acetyltransferase
MNAPRLLNPGDAEAYVALRKEALVDSPRAFGASPECDRASDVVLVRAMLERHDQAIIGIVDGSRILASTGVRREEAPKRRHIATVWGVYVTPAGRGRGLGKSVVSAAVAHARGWDDVVCVHLSVGEGSGAARSLYESLGFVVWGTEPSALSVNGQLYNEIHMHLEL